MALVRKFADTFVDDLQAGRIPPHPSASLHIISFMKESKQYMKGQQLWEWLQLQDDTHVGPRVYGAAIELFAYQGRMKLQDLEELYKEAFARFPGSFAEYHMRPDGILPDRGQYTSIPGASLSLLQGILTARVLHGDWRNAYLSLDTALRLYPDETPPRIFEIFTLERPISEAYMIFLMMCRCSKDPPKPRQLTTSVLNRLANAQSRLQLNDRFRVVEAMLHAIYVFVGAGGTLCSPHVGIIIKSLENVMPETLYRPANTKNCHALDSILEFASELPALFAQVGITPEPSTFGQLISLAGKAHRPDMIVSILTKLSGDDVPVEPALYRVALLAAGHMGDKDLIETLWGNFVGSQESKGEQIQESSWMALARAGRRAQHQEFVLEQISKSRHTLTDTIMARIDRALAVEPQIRRVEAFHSEEITTGVEHLRARVMQVIDLMKANGRINFYQDRQDLAIQPREPLGNEDDLRTIYDELTTDLTQGEPMEQVPPEATSEDQIQPNPVLIKTGFPLDELRYENWKSINELLAEAQRYEAKQEEALEEAMKSGKPFQRSQALDDLFLVFSSKDPTETKNPITHFNNIDQQIKGPLKRLSNLRARIYELRGITKLPPNR
jgi:hypothetical protein